MANLVRTGKRFHPIPGEKGQAAVTDALFLLVIITGLMAFLFTFTVGYGKGLSDQVSRNTNFEFVASALKTIMYQSVPRNADTVLQPNNADQEIDYLMAQVKEDYADDANISINTQKNLTRTVYEVMRPIADTHDYLFVINTAQKYVFVMLWRTEFASYQINPSTGNPQRFQDIGVQNPAHKMYFCSPTLTSDALQRFKLRVGNTTEVETIVNMVEFTGSSLLLSQDSTETRAGVSLATWVATPIRDAEWQAMNCVPVPITLP